MAQKIVYLDCHSGISGDMLLGSLLDAGLPFELLSEKLAGLPVTGYELKREAYSDQGIVGTRFDVVLSEREQPTRRFTDIVEILQSSALATNIQERAIEIFRTLGEAEAAVHGVTLEDIHFHEVGAVDAIVDIVGAVIGLDALNITQVYASPLPLTRGHLRMAHGLMPVPAPATLEILSRVRAPWVPSPLEGEFVTPTGAAILATLARFEMPAIAIEEVGYGFGQKRTIWPNCVRACLGSSYQVGVQKSQLSEQPHKHEHEHEQVESQPREHREHR